MTKPTGPLHPLLIPNQCSNSITIDFISPLPLNDSFNAIVTITDRLGSDIQITATHTNITAKHFASQFFNLWYCKNGLPLNIISDHDKIFISKFWKALHTLTKVKLKMSFSYHPETNGTSECSNKTIEQALWYHVNWNQKGWVKALPLNHFNMMNTVNASTGFSPFQLCMGRSLWLIPPLTSTHLQCDLPDDMDYNAVSLIETLTLNTMQAQDNLLTTKVAQAEFTNHHRSDELVFTVGYHVLLSTKHWCQEYMQTNSGCVTKFMPQYDSPFKITCTHPESSTYILLLPNKPNRFPTFHLSLLQIHTHRLWPVSITDITSTQACGYT